jgi:hypothetical protein
VTFFHVEEALLAAVAGGAEPTISVPINAMSADTTTAAHRDEYICRLV